MLQSIKNKLIVLASLLTFTMPVLAPVAASAQVTPKEIKESLCGGTSFQINNPNNCPQGTGPDTLEAKIAKAVNILSAIIGIVAVIMIIFAGFRYITSGGSQERIKGAKDTLLYAIIGLVIVALSQLIVRFVLRNVQ